MRSLALRGLELEPEDITYTVAFLEAYHRPTLTSVTVELHETRVDGINDMLADSLVTGLCKNLELTMLKFSRPLLEICIRHTSGYSFWDDELKKNFSELCRRGALTVTSNPSRLRKLKVRPSPSLLL